MEKSIPPPILCFFLQMIFEFSSVVDGSFFLKNPGNLWKTIFSEQIGDVRSTDYLARLSSWHKRPLSLLLVFSISNLVRKFSFQFWTWSFFISRENLRWSLWLPINPSINHILLPFLNQSKWNSNSVTSGLPWYLSKALQETCVKLAAAPESRQIRS